MKKLLLYFTTMFIFSIAYGQIVPTDRLVDWESAMQTINIIQPEYQINVMDFGAVGDGITNDQSAIMDAISALNGQLGSVYFPEGEYLLEEPISLTDSCILKGAGSEQSTLIFNLNNESVNCIVISKTQSNNFVDITSGVDKGSSFIAVSNVNNFNIGDYIEIRQENGDWDITPISWADYSVGQVTRITNIIGDSIALESELRIDYSMELNPQVRIINPISNAGIQCIKIKRIDEPVEGAGSNVYMNMAANCFVRGVESDSSVGSHVSINTCINILVDGSYFHHAFTYDGAGTRGYGVTLSHHSSNCLITNNMFRHLRHAMMIKTGANGNVFSYNYSIEPHRSEQIPDASGDISFHGHYAYANLFEGNIAQNIIIDHYWGPSGPYNTLLRNRAALYGIVMTTNDLFETNTQNFVGNEVTNTTIFHGMYVLTGENQFQYGNNVKGQIIPSGTTELNDTSYYLSQSPYFWDETLNWPSVGMPNALGEGTIPAKIRWASGENITVCPDSVAVSISNNLQHNSKIEIWPNPARDYIVFKLDEELEGMPTVKLISTSGRIVIIKEVYIINSQSTKLDVRNVEAGIYVIVVEIGDKVVRGRVVVLSIDE